MSCNETDRILIVGGDSLIGQALDDCWTRKGKRVLKTSRRENALSETCFSLDLERDISSWRPPSSVSVAYLCVAISSLEECQKNSLQTALVNIHNTIKLAEILVSNGIHVIFPSSNRVYDGSCPFQKADNPTCPKTEYGRQKAEVERQLLAFPESVSIVRFTKIIHSNLPLLKGWIKLLQNGEGIHPFSDMVMSPISLSFAVNVLSRIAETGAMGITQVSGERDVTYEEIARFIARHMCADYNLVQPVKAQKGGLQHEDIPSHTTLDVTRLQMALGLHPRPVWSTIDSAVKPLFMLVQS